MTNFKKWKAGLTMNDMTKLLAFTCEFCPFGKMGKGKCPPAKAGNLGQCREAVREWGEQEVKDE